MDEIVRVLVVDDSAFMRKLITDFLNEDERFEVVGTARNGKDALEKVERYNPDVITLDIEMPIMNGLEALKNIMKNNPTPTVILSSTTEAGTQNALLAMQLGAIDVIAKPSGSISIDLYKIKEELTSKVYNASEVNLDCLVSVSLENSNKAPLSSNPKVDLNDYSKKIICIGTSTGGPRALQSVLTKLPKSINAPILVVQHMPAGFTRSLAQRLNSISEIHVKEAETGEVIQNGTAYIAPGNYHLTVGMKGKAFVTELNQHPPRNGHRPSVDSLFDSVSLLKECSKIAVIMTGMGSDGAEGLKKLKTSGNTYAIAESQESCVVFGMPKSAIETNYVNEVVHLGNIASSIIRAVE